jgi:hypothetical protein
MRHLLPLALEQKAAHISNLLYVRLIRHSLPPSQLLPSPLYHPLERRFAFQQTNPLQLQQHAFHILHLGSCPVSLHFLCRGPSTKMQRRGTWHSLRGRSHNG